MSLRLAVQQLRAQVQATTPTTGADRPFIPHVRDGGVMSLRQAVAANPIGRHRHFDLEIGMPVDDGEAAVTDRRERVVVTIVLVYEWPLLCQHEDAGLMLGEDVTAINRRLWDPGNWDASTTLIEDLVPGTPRAVRIGDADVVLLELPITIVYH